MDRALVRMALCAAPVLALIFYGLTRMMPPLWGYVIGLCVYWLGLAIVLLWRHSLGTPRHWMRPV